MSAFARELVTTSLALIFSVVFVGCATTPIPSGAPSPSQAASPSQSPTPSPAPSPSDAVSPSATVDGLRFIIDCVGPEGLVIGPFTRLEEAWASTNYVRIDHCVASPATDRPVELRPEEQRVAETAAVDMPDEDLLDLYLSTLATCVRVAPTSEQGLPALPTSLLRAALELCPEAPHAGLIEDELESRSQ